MEPLIVMLVAAGAVVGYEVGCWLLRRYTGRGGHRGWVTVTVISDDGVLSQRVPAGGSIELELPGGFVYGGERR